MFKQNLINFFLTYYIIILIVFFQFIFIMIDQYSEDCCCSNFTDNDPNEWKLSVLRCVKSSKKKKFCSNKKTKVNKIYLIYYL